MNPLYSGGSSQNNVTAPSNNLNNASPSVRRTFNRFNNGYTHYTSALYGEYTPFFVQDCIAGDVHKFRSKSQVRTLSLKTPLYSGVKMNKDYFFVPYDAILPFNWQKIFRNPSQGDDVPDDANTMIPDFTQLFKVLDMFTFTMNELIDSNDEVARGYLLNFLLRLFPLCDSLFSSGGLLARLGYNFGSIFKFKVTENAQTSHTYTSWDRFTEVLYPKLFVSGASFTLSFDESRVISFNIADVDDISQSTSFPAITSINAKDAMSIWRYFGDYCNADDQWATVLSETSDAELKPTVTKYVAPYPDVKNKVFNYSRCVAYNITCAQFYTNGNVDSVYNAQLYRDLLSSQIRPILPNYAFKTFTYNGISVPYDYASGHYMNLALAYLDTSKGAAIQTNYTQYVSVISYLKSIFCIQNSLKYGDYFTGSHTRPLAVGDVTAPVVGNEVSAVDITKAIAYQRFFNVVVKLKNDFKEYLQSIFGTIPAPDYHEAKFVSHSEGNVDGFEVANTSSSEQGNLVTLLHSVNENYEFTLECDMPGISLGIVSFVASRAYSQVKERSFFVRDRFDMFNPMLQNIGDQSIYPAEKSPFGVVPFGYHSRFMEYKQRVNVASGAFQDTLRSYCIISDSAYSTANALELLAPTLHPCFIRLLPRELDRFFVNQSAWSYGNGFHFICEFDNVCDDVREADYAPSIL